MGRSRRFVWSLAAVAFVGIGGTGIGIGIGAQAASRVQTAALVKTTPAQMLVTGQGMALYVYAPDKKNKSTCYDECAEYWPPMTVSAGMKAPAAMPGVKGTFGVTTRTNGKRQLTYDGAPLYTFIEDKKPGQMTGQGLDVAGGYWWAVVVPRSSVSAASASGSAQPAQSAPAPTATPATGGYYGGTSGTIGDDHHRNRGDRTTPTPGSYYGGGHGGHGGDG